MDQGHNEQKPDTQEISVSVLTDKDNVAMGELFTTSMKLVSGARLIPHPPLSDINTGVGKHELVEYLKRPADCVVASFSKPDFNHDYTSAIGELMEAWSESPNPPVLLVASHTPDTTVKKVTGWMDSHPATFADLHKRVLVYDGKNPSQSLEHAIRIARREMKPSTQVSDATVVQSLSSLSRG